MTNEPAVIWEEVLSNLRANTENEDFETWILPARPSDYDGRTFTLSVPSSIYRESILHQFKRIIESSLQEITQNDIVLRINTDTEHKSEHPAQPEPFKSNLQTRYTFENFVIGSSNNFCSAAAMAVADNPGHCYNPLFIYGGVGLGKTHLLNAVGNRVIKQYPHLRVLYISSETFVNDLIHAIAQRSTTEFRRLYRQVDLLLIDDIQFIAGKVSTQEEFFHTFNTLINAQKQIVITSDRTPSEINDLEQRIISRLSSGLTADIQPPDIETRLAIIERKCRMEGYSITPDVALLLAEKVTSNVRNIEGALNTLFAYALMVKEPINMATAERVIKDIVSPSFARITTNDILQKVAQYYNVTVSEITGKNRQSSIMLPRQVAIYLCRKHTNSSLTEIGRIFKRDHTTVLHSIEKITSLMTSDKSMRESMDRLNRMLVEKR